MWGKRETFPLTLGNSGAMVHPMGIPGSAQSQEVSQILADQSSLELLCAAQGMELGSGSSAWSQPYFPLCPPASCPFCPPTCPQKHPLVTSSPLSPPPSDSYTVQVRPSQLTSLWGHAEMSMLVSAHWCCRHDLQHICNTLGMYKWLALARWTVRITLPTHFIKNVIICIIVPIKICNTTLWRTHTILVLQYYTMCHSPPGVWTGILGAH